MPRYLLVIFMTASLGCGATHTRSDGGTGAGRDGGAPGAVDAERGLRDGSAIDAGRARDGGSPGECIEQPGPAPLRSLTRKELAAAFEGLLGATPPSLADVTASTHPEGWRAGPLYVADEVRTAYEVAREAAQMVTSDVDRFAPCPAGMGEYDCAVEFIRTFGLRAWRRPLASDEQGGLARLFDHEDDYAAGIALVVEAMLQSPYFLYRPELGVAAPGESSRRLGDYEVAARLASLLWAGVPDEALLEAAGEGELGTSERVQRQARRMLDDPRVEHAAVQFARTWLGYEDVSEPPDGEGMPLGDALRELLVEETDAYVAHVWTEEDAGFDTLLASPFTLANDTLAAYYGVEPPGADALVRVDLPATRASLLTHGSVLASHQTPTHRGLLVRTRLLCEEPPPPPPDVDGDSALPSYDPSEPTTRRQRYETLLDDPSCASCHSLLDPIGFGLESFDASGHHRTEDRGLPVDDSGEIAGDVDGAGRFEGGPELAERLANSRDVHACHVRQWIRLGLRRVVTDEDACAIDAALDAFEASDLDLRELLVALVGTRTFRYRPAEEVRPRSGTTPPSTGEPLDLVAHDLANLRAQLGGDDGRRLEAHLDAIRELERRLGR